MRHGYSRPLSTTGSSQHYAIYAYASGNGSFTVKRGVFTAGSSAAYTILTNKAVISGGQVTVTAAEGKTGIRSTGGAGTITLSCEDDEDFIKASSYRAAKSVNVADGYALKEEKEQI